MKKLLLLIFLSFSFRLFAQPNAYRPFPEDSALWIVDWVTPHNNPPILRDVYIMHGDTIFNNVSYNKIYKESNVYNYPYGPSTVSSAYKYIGAMRQDSTNKKVFFRSDTMSTDTLLYNFNLKIGDTLSATYLKLGSGMFNPVVVTNIKDTLINGIHHNRFIFNHSSIYGNLIEGVGSDCGLFEMGAHFEGGPSMNCFKTHDISPIQLIGVDTHGNYHYGQYPCGYYFSISTGVRNEESGSFQFELSPNPSTGLIAINSSEKFQYSVYDVFGRLVLESTDINQRTFLNLSGYPKGIYFVRGKAGGNFFSKKIILQ
jgi:hypothetical protein